MVPSSDFIRLAGMSLLLCLYDTAWVTARVCNDSGCEGRFKSTLRRGGGGICGVLRKCLKTFGQDCSAHAFGCHVSYQFRPTFSCSSILSHKNR